MKNYARFLLDLVGLCGKHHIKLKAISTQSIKLGRSGACTGYFSKTSKQIVIATGGRFSNWGSILVHESCHLDQYLDNRIKFNQSDCLDLLETTYKSKNHPKYLEYLTKIVNLERDCELRSIKKMKFYKLPFNIIRYIQGANAYLLNYTTSSIFKVKTPYTNKQICTLMPKKIMPLKWLLNPPKWVKTLYNKECY